MLAPTGLASPRALIRTPLPALIRKARPLARTLRTDITQTLYEQITGWQQQQVKQQNLLQLAGGAVDAGVAMQAVGLLRGTARVPLTMGPLRTGPLLPGNVSQPVPSLDFARFRRLRAEIGVGASFEVVGRDLDGLAVAHGHDLFSVQVLKQGNASAAAAGATAQAPVSFRQTGRPT